MRPRRRIGVRFLGRWRLALPAELVIKGGLADALLRNRHPKRLGPARLPAHGLPLTAQYRGTLGSTSWLQRVMPPARLMARSNPAARSSRTALALRTPPLQ